MSSGTESIPMTSGVVLIGMGMTAMLYGITCAQTFWYYQAYAEGDPLWIKLLTGSIWFFNTVHTAAVIHIPYFYLVTASGNTELLNTTVCSLPISTIVLAIVSVQVYAFYMRRIWILSRSRVLCGALSILTAGHFVATFTFGIRGLFIDKTMSQYFSSSSLAVLRVATGFGTVTDALSAASITYCLSKSRTGYKNTDTTINLLITYTINTGVLASLCVMASLVTDLAWPESYITLFFLFLIAPLETNSYLGSLNAREYFHRKIHNKSHNLSTLSSGMTPQAVEIRVDQTMNTFGAPNQDVKRAGISARSHSRDRRADDALTEIVMSDSDSIEV